MPDRIRFGLELVANKRDVTVSTVVMRAIEEALEREGITSREQGQMLTLLQRVWDESAPVRILKVAEVAPELLSKNDRNFLHFVEERRRKEGRELTEEELQEYYEMDFLY